jgi:hypothetical protein
MTTYDEVLAEAGGDPKLALAIICDRFDWTCRKVSAGLVRANTSHLKWQPKKPPDTTATGDEWLETAADGRE